MRIFESSTFRNSAQIPHFRIAHHDIRRAQLDPDRRELFERVAILVDEYSFGMGMIAMRKPLLLMILPTLVPKTSIHSYRKS